MTIGQYEAIVFFVVTVVLCGWWIIDEVRKVESRRAAHTHVYPHLPENCPACQVTPYL